MRSACYLLHSYNTPCLNLPTNKLLWFLIIRRVYFPFCLTHLIKHDRARFLLPTTCNKIPCMSIFVMFFKRKPPRPQKKGKEAYLDVSLFNYKERTMSNRAYVARENTSFFHKFNSSMFFIFFLRWHHHMWLRSRYVLDITLCYVDLVKHMSHIKA